MVFLLTFNWIWAESLNLFFLFSPDRPWLMKDSSPSQRESFLYFRNDLPIYFQPWILVPLGTNYREPKSRTKSQVPLGTKYRQPRAWQILTPSTAYFMVYPGLFGCKGLTIICWVAGCTTKSISSIGTAPRSVSLPKTKAPTKQNRF